MPGVHDSTVSSYLSRASYSNNGGRCKNDILGALHHYNGLKPKLDKFTFNDGRTRDLIVLDGTIPVPYRQDFFFFVLVYVIVQISVCMYPGLTNAMQEEFNSFTRNIFMIRKEIILNYV